MTILPIQAPAAQSWTELARQDADLVSSPAAGGVCSVLFPQVPVDQYWLVEHIVVQNNSVANTSARVYLDDTNPSNLRDGTYVGNMDVADYASPLLAETARSLLIQWTGCNNGDVGRAYIQYRVFKRLATF